MENIATQYSGFMLAAVVMLMAVYFLPSKTRIFVLTAGIPLLGTRAWQIYDTHKKLMREEEKSTFLRMQFSLLKGRMRPIEKGIIILENKIQVLENHHIILTSQFNATSPDSVDYQIIQLKFNKQRGVILQQIQSLKLNRKEHINALQAVAEIGKQVYIYH